MNYDELTDRELDALVAKKILGWPIDPGLQDCTAFVYPPKWNDELGVYPSTAGRQADCEWFYCEHWASDIAAAFEVVEAMREHLFSVRWKFLLRLREEAGRIDDKTLVDWPDVFFRIKPRHICIAALRALEE